MKVRSNQFIELSQIAVKDEALQTAVARATHIASTNRVKALAEVNQAHGETLRQQAAAIKRSVLNRLPELLEMAEANLTANGCTVMWAEDGAEACQLALEIAQKHHVKKVTKSKSMVTEEIGLNEVLLANGIETIETDLGEYIVQLNEDTPSHIIAPVIHMSKKSIGQLFEEKLKMPPTDDAAEMTQFVRAELREAFLSSDMGISGGNFIIAETGTLCLVTNEGNARMVTTVPPVHVALIGLEKLVATVEDYATLTQMIARSATGQKMAVYTHMINGPRRNSELDGPEHVYVIFVDNGRSRIYGSEYVEVLACLRCGACLNACPVYQVTGGHSYGWVYSGPIGAVVTPLLLGQEHASPLPFASTLCGSCKAACPVDIDLPRMLLDLRRDMVADGVGRGAWQLGMKAWAASMTTPTRFNLSGKAVSLFTNTFKPRRLPGALGGWTDHRVFPSFAKKSFRDQWRDREKKGKPMQEGDDQSG
jgi:L-lactate dehydrogenase complex protein LldF